MCAHNGMSAKVLAYVRQHPGCLRTEVLEALGLPGNSTVPTYCVREGHCFSAGPRRALRYYPTAEQAQAADAALRAEAERKAKAKRDAAHRRANLKLRIARQERGVAPKQTRPGRGFAIDAQTILSKDCRYTACPSGQDFRHTPRPGEVQPFFSSMAPGSYLRTGSAIERAYAEREGA